MYQAPQTFYDDDTPPASPVAGQRIPHVQISEAPNVEHKMEYQRWHNTPGKNNSKYSTPFSYEYTIVDGRLAGLAEYHPDEDYLHYSSSRSTSRTGSRSNSTRTSRDISTRPSLEVRKSTSSQTFQLPHGPLSPLSPTKATALKRALSLRGLKGRRSTEEKKSTPLSPHARPEIEELAASFGSRGPQLITCPIQLPLLQHVQEMFETPRPAPRPPMRHADEREERPTPLRERNANASVLQVKRSRTPDYNITTRPINSSKRSEPEGSPAPGTAITTQVRFETQPTRRSPPPKPMLRSKTSKFFEHLDSTQASAKPMSESFQEIPPLPKLLPPFDFQLPSPPLSAEVSPQHKRNFPMRRSQTIRAAPAPVGNKQHNIVRKRSASNMKSLPPTPGPLPKRSVSTQIRPTPQMSDVCMAQVKPIMLGPVIASGHARMISC